MFNLAKKGYHSRNEYAYNELVYAINESEYVDVVRMSKEDFYEFLDCPDRHHRTPEVDEFKTAHVLMFLSERSSSAATVLREKDHDEAPMRIDRLFPIRRNMKVPYLPPEERKVKISNMLNELKLLAPFPLRSIKQAELHSIWGPLLPKEAVATTCPKPSDEIVEF